MREVIERLRGFGREDCHGVVRGAAARRLRLADGATARRVEQSEFDREGGCE